MLARVSLGHRDLTVRAIGLGCMGMSQSYGDADDDVSAATIRTALDLGADFLDTSDVYGASDITWGVPIRGFGHNEELIGRAIAGRRDDVVLATKFGLISHRQDGARALDSSPASMRVALEGRSGVSAPTTSTSTTSTASIPARRSRRRSAHWANWSPKARSATSACRRPLRP
jgi:aryl-alcohol dehydrogenase-like predicted oxidoreductase